MSLANIHSAFYFAPYAQYSICIFLLLFFFVYSPRTLFTWEDIFIYSTMFILCLTSYLYGMSMGMSVNIKPLVLTTMLAFLNSRLLPVKLLKSFLFFLVAFLIIEYAVAYTQVIPTFHLNYVRIFSLIRPLGLFLDMHLTAYFVVFSLFVLGYLKFSGIISIFFGSFQIVLGWIVLALRKTNPIYIFISSLFVVYMLYKIGHFNLGKSSESMVSVLLNIVNYEINYQCLILGCSVNIDSLNLANIDGNRDTLNDFGYYRVLYQFGLLWVILLVFSLRRYNKLFVLANIVMWVHYPISLGVLGFVLFIYLLHCMKYKEYIDGNKSRSVRALDF
jgi:hypothetical protein